jgi:hypothetical protein
MPDIIDDIWCYEELDAAGRTRVDELIARDVELRKEFEEARRFRRVLSRAARPDDPNMEELLAFLLATLFFSPDSNEKRRRVWEDLVSRSSSSVHLKAITNLYVQRLKVLLEDRDSTRLFESLSDSPGDSDGSEAGPED